MALMASYAAGLGLVYDGPGLKLVGAGGDVVRVWGFGVFMGSHFLGTYPWSPTYPAAGPRRLDGTFLRPVMRRQDVDVEKEI